MTCISTDTLKENILARYRMRLILLAFFSQKNFPSLFCINLLSRELSSRISQEVYSADT